MTPILSIITRHVHPSLRDKVTPDAALKDLDLHLIGLVGITCDIEEHFNVAFSGDPEATWETVADILEAAGKTVFGSAENARRLADMAMAQDQATGGDDAA